MPDNQSSCKDELEFLQDTNALIDKKIRRANIKSISGALIGTTLAGALAVFFCPFTNPFFGLLSVIAWTTFISINAFSIFYQLLFYWIAKDLITKAKQRKKYLTDRLFRFCRPYSFSSFQNDSRTPDFYDTRREDPISDPSCRHLPFNIYYDNSHNRPFKD